MTLKAVAGGGTGGGGAAISAGTNSATSGTVVFSNANGVSFGMDTNGVVTATVTPGAAAGIAAIRATNVTYTSGTVLFSGSNAAVVKSGANQSVFIDVSTSLSNVNLSAGGTSQNLSAFVLSNSNNVSFGLNGSTLTATATIAATVFSNSNNVSFGLNGSTITATATFAGAGGVAVSAAGASASDSTVVFSNSNNVSFGMNGRTVTATATVAQTNQTIGAYAVSNTTQSTSGTIDARSLSFHGAGAASVGVSNGSVMISVAAGAQSNQTEGFYAVGNTTQNSSTTLDARTVSFGGRGDITVGYSGGTIQISGNQTNQSVGLYGLGNTTQNSSTTLDARTISLNGLGGMTVGYSNGSVQLSAPGTSSISATGIVSISVNGSTVSIGAGPLSAFAVSNTTQSSSGTWDPVALSFAGAGAVSVGVSNGSVIISAAAGGQTNQSVGFYGVGNTTQNSSTTLDARTVSFGGRGDITVGYSNGTIQISGTQTNQSLGLYAVSNTTQSTSGTVDARTLSFQGAGGVSVGISNGSVVISGGAGGGGAAISAAGASASNGTVVFSNSNNVSFGMAGSTVTATITVPAQTNQTAGLYALGNTTQNSSTTLDVRTHSFNALGAMTMGFSNGSIQVSAPATSSLSATGLVSISTNGSTISIGVPGGVQSSYWQPEDWNITTVGAPIGATASVVYLAMQMPLTGTRFDVAISQDVATAANASTAGVNYSMTVVLLTKNAQTFNSVSSTTRTAGATWSSNNTSNVTGAFFISAPLNINASPGQYWAAIQLSTLATGNTLTGANTTSLGNTITMLGVGSGQAGAISIRDINAGTASSLGWISGMGLNSSTGNLTAMSVSNISQVGTFFNRAAVAVRILG